MVNFDEAVIFQSFWRSTMEFKDKVKLVRKGEMMSQEAMAQELGVAFATVNRWESGKCKPNYSAQRAFAEFCKRHNVDLDALEKSANVD